MPHQNLYKQIFSNASSPELENIVKEHPYFGLAHFFLLKDIPSDHPDAERIAARTALHFNNPYLLNQQLKKQLRAEEAGSAVMEEEQETEAVSGIIAEPAAEAAGNLNEEIASISPEAELVDFSPIYLPEEKETFPAVQLPETEPEVSAKKEIPGMEIPREKTTKTDALLFEPLHTTDYFASQGIKISDEVQPTDKLGKQLRSFTEWLKTMKKVHESKLPEGNEQLDASVNKLAEKSNRDEEVITEAMAEAYLIQGKPEKAKDVYLKLSLLNPSKNAYFAAKIDEITC